MSDGADQVSVAVPLPGVAGPIAGAAGTPGCGVTERDAADDGPMPTRLIAATVNEYAVPFAKPPNVVDVTVPTVIEEPSDEVIR